MRTIKDVPYGDVMTRRISETNVWPIVAVHSRGCRSSVAGGRKMALCARVFGRMKLCGFPNGEALLFRRHRFREAAVKDTNACFGRTRQSTTSTPATRRSRDLRRTIINDQNQQQQSFQDVLRVNQTSSNPNCIILVAPVTHPRPWS